MRGRCFFLGALILFPRVTDEAGSSTGARRILLNVEDLHICVRTFLQQAEWHWNHLACESYAKSQQSWLTRHCLAWLDYDKEIEATIATDILDSRLGRCFRVEIVAPVYRSGFGLCTPKSCSASDIRRHLPTFLDLETLTRKTMSFSTIMSKNITELASWSDLAGLFHFVIPGFANSGTTSLVRTLSAHPQVHFDSMETSIPSSKGTLLNELGESFEDLDWRHWLCADLLPMPWVNSIKQSVSKSRDKVRGFKQPLLLYSETCIRNLARVPKLKLVVIVRDPVDWLLSIHNRDEELVGLAVYDEVPGRVFNRQDGKFGSILKLLLEYFPGDRVLAVELEHLKDTHVAPVVLDAIKDFLELTEPPTQKHAAVAPWGSSFQYDPGSLKKDARSWQLEEFCFSERSRTYRSLAQWFEPEYQIFPRLLTSVGVRKLGVSALLLGGGVLDRDCRLDVNVPQQGPLQWPLSHMDSWTVHGVLSQTGSRIKNFWRGELGYNFRLKLDLPLAMLGCGAGAGPLKQSTYVTVWDTTNHAVLATTRIDPSTYIEDGFAVSKLAQSVYLQAGVTYAITVQVSPGLGLAPAMPYIVEPTFMEFCGGTFSYSPWIFPTQSDLFSWAAAYLNLVTFRAF